MNNPFSLSRAEVREVDRRAVDEFGVPSIVLMENAGRGAAELLMRLNPERLPVAILCGPGNNGGDGFVVARHLSIHQFPVHILLALSHDNAESIESHLSSDARVNYQIAKRSGIGIETLRSPLNEQQREAIQNDLTNQSGWIVDGLFGTGLRAPSGPPFSDLIDAANRSNRPIFALDLPSGLECDQGVPLGTTIRAAHTATFVALKKGFLEPTAREWVGEVHVVDIGAPRVLVDQYRNRRQ